MSRSRSNVVPPHDGQVSPGGRNSSIGRSYQASALCCSKMSAARSISSGVRTASRQLVQSTAGIGTPHARWREMHQSGRFDTMLKMRSRPQDGNPFHLVIDGVARRVSQRAGLAVFARHRGVAVQPHEPLRRSEEDHRVVAAPAVRILVRERLTMPEPASCLRAPVPPSGWHRRHAARQKAGRCRGNVHPVRSARRSPVRT